MKTAILALLSAVAVSHAAIIRFDLSPAGTDVAVGLSPSNMVPAVTNSTGSGDSISGGIYFDTDTSLLHLAIGYGSAAGFTDLTSPVTGISINHAAPAGANAPPLFSLTLLSFPALDPAKGGVIYGSVVYPADPVLNPVSNLLAGLEYIVIYTASNPATAGNRDGELRGQLIPLVNVAPQVSCPGDATVQCGSAVTYSATVSDADGEPLRVVWSLNGHAVHTNRVAAGGPPTSATVPFTAALPLGTNTLGVTATDSTGNSASCSSTVIVVDTIPPVIAEAASDPSQLWPPNHKMVTVNVRARINDACGPTAWRIISVSSNEPVNGTGDGDTDPDWQITGDHTVKLRAERSGSGSGRVYTITIRATDAAGNRSDTKTVRVTVPHNQGGGAAPAPVAPAPAAPSGATPKPGKPSAS